MSKVATRKGQRIVVATRFILATATVTPKQALGVARAYAKRITRNADPVELRHAYLEMAEKIRPLATLLEDVIIQRSNEARKLKNVQTWLRSVDRCTDPKWIADVPDDELDIALPMRLESLIEALKSLARVESRLTGYAEVERVLPHGRYQIINELGYRPEECAGALRILDAASDVIAKAGFSQAVYGKVTLESEAGAKWAGRYDFQGDSIRLNMGVTHRDGSAVYSLVHELGHRIWFQFLSTVQRDSYEDAYAGTADATVTLKDREAFWNALEATEFDPKKALTRLSEELRPTFNAYWKHVNKGTRLMGLAPKQRRIIFVAPMHRHVVFDHGTLKSVTDYGRTNVREDFAEVFAHHCLGKTLTPDAADRFRAATGKQ